MRDQESGIATMYQQKKSTDSNSVVDPGCLSRIELYIPDQDPNCLHPGSRNLKEKYFNARNSQKIIDRLYKI
jgi:hypothetical protein